MARRNVSAAAVTCAALVLSVVIFAAAPHAADATAQRVQVGGGASGRGAAGVAAPTPPQWPVAFSVAFLTKNGTGAPGMLWYDWALQAQRIDHAPGSYEC